MSEDSDKINKEGIEAMNATPIFLLIKQAVATGWDCPRAKILVKLRENMGEDFTIQTIGRIRRMPEAIHYNDEVLDNCYLSYHYLHSSILTLIHFHKYIP